MHQSDKLLAVASDEKIQLAEKLKIGANGGKHLDEILLQLGKPGLYHIICFFFLYSGAIFVAVHNTVMTATIGVTPTKYHCKSSLQYFSNKTLNELQFLKCHVKLKGNSTIERPCDSWTYEGTDDGKIESIVTEAFGCKFCPHQHDYYHNSPPFYLIAFLFQWDLVCDRKFYPQLSNTVYFVGVLSGAATLSHLSDIYGRRLILLIFGIMAILVSVATALLRHFIIFMIARFLLGIFISGLQTNVNVTIAELVPTNYKKFVQMCFIAISLTSTAVGAVMQWFLRNWWQAQLIIAVPFLLPLAIAFFFLPESFRWLIVHNRYEELSRHLKRAASINKVKLSTTTVLVDDDMESGNKKVDDLKKQKIPWVICFKYKEMRRRTLSLFFIWIAAALTYYTLSLNLKNITKDPYRAYAIASAVDVLPAFLTAVIWNKVGKRRIMYSYTFFGGLMCVVYKFYDHIAIMIIGKATSGVTLSLAYFFTIDLFPTSTRNFALGACVTVSRLGSLLSPQIVLLGVYTTPDLPVIISGVFCLVSSVLIFFLPETTGMSLPGTINDVENYRLEKKSKKLLKSTNEQNDEAGMSCTKM